MAALPQGVSRELGVPLAESAGGLGHKHRCAEWVWMRMLYVRRAVGRGACTETDRTRRLAWTLAALLLLTPPKGHGVRVRKKVNVRNDTPVSYTHLTLPTICSV